MGSHLDCHPLLCHVSGRAGWERHPHPGHSDRQCPHAHMYLFLGLLSLTDLALSSTTVPKTLAIFWFQAGEISFDGCLAQMFCVHSVYALDSSVPLAMAFNLYVAICNPVRYTTILNCAVIGRIGLVAIFRSIAVVSPFIFLLRRLPYCQHHVMAHTYCEHMGMA